MALGFSGSNAGITQKFKSIYKKDIMIDNIERMYSYPLEVSYFVNNICNLKCRHCYVGYEEKDNSLTVDKWERVFDEFIAMGALTFGNVGKEPTLDWEKTINLLKYFRDKREKETKLRFGLVTNAILLDGKKSTELNEINPNYLDISLDGTEEIHDMIRGRGSYSKVMANIKSFPQDLLNKVFISFTANRLNLHTISELIDKVYKIGIRNILISPYVSRNIADNINDDNLITSEEDIIIEIKKLLKGELVNFDNYNNINIYIKSDFTSLYFMQKLKDKKIIDIDNLKIDDYGAIFTKYIFNSNSIYFNYLPWDNSFIQAVRISHDGFISNCYDMFFKDYQNRAIGNVKYSSIAQILNGSKLIINPNLSHIPHYMPTQIDSLSIS